jgi:hypothetical protein
MMRLPDPDIRDRALAVGNAAGFSKQIRFHIERDRLPEDVLPPVQPIGETSNA